MALAHDAASAGEQSPLKLTRNLPIITSLHQAAVNVSDTKRHQDQAAQLFQSKRNFGYQFKETPAREIASEGSDTSPTVSSEVSETDDAKAARRRSRQNGKSEPAANVADSSSKPAVDQLSSAQLSDAVHDKAVAS